MDFTTFSADDLAILKGVVYREKIRAKNTTGRGAVPGYPDPEPTTEVYIAKVHALGIPALTETPNHLSDIPGVRTCDIYRILLESGVPRLRPLNSNQPVYNLSLQEVVEADVPWIKIVREKFGNWLADVGGVTGVGTGSDSEPLCGLLVLDCPEDGDCPGTGSEVSVSPPIGSPPISTGYTSICNSGEVVSSRLYLTVTYGTKTRTVALTTTDGSHWTYTGGAVSIGSCGAGFQLVEVNMYCTDRGWILDSAFNVPVLTAFSNPADYPKLAAVTTTPFHYRTTSYGKVTTGCGFEYIVLDVTQ